MQEDVVTSPPPFGGSQRTIVIRVAGSGTPPAPASMTHTQRRE